MEMELKQALAIVLDLAEQNAFTQQDCAGDPALEREVAKQDAALEAVRIHLEAMWGAAIGRDAAALRRHKGLSSGKSAKGWNAKPRELSERAITLRGWRWDRDAALSIYTRLVFPERDFDPFDPNAPDTMEAVIAARQAAERDALLATF